MKKYIIDCYSEAQHEMIDELIDRLSSFNAKFIGKSDYPEVINLIIKEDDKLIAGLEAKIFLNVMDIKTLWVDEIYRKHGIGKKLIERAEEVAFERKLDNIYLTTFHFQAVDFYLKLGYEHLFTIDDYVKGGNLNYFRKKLN